MPVPVPQDLGRASPTLYPTSFNAVYQGDAWSFVLSDFVTVGEEGNAAASIEVLDAQTGWLQARTSLISATFDLNVNRAMVAHPQPLHRIDIDDLP